MSTADGASAETTALPVPSTVVPDAWEEGHGLRRKAVAGAVWIGVGFAEIYLLRLASGIIMTRLVAPGVFGLLDIARSVPPGGIASGERRG